MIEDSSHVLTTYSGIFGYLWCEIQAPNWYSPEPLRSNCRFWFGTCSSHPIYPIIPLITLYDRLKYQNPQFCFSNSTRHVFCYLLLGVGCIRHLREHFCVACDDYGSLWSTFENKTSWWKIMFSCSCALSGRVAHCGKRLKSLKFTAFNNLQHNTEAYQT